ncbi:MAG: hypothetical protein HUN04_23375 [Desulfobacter sp.]|nr:MAG: hypothetical protein HUN04_23375 [Desulfobacter sp.]
MTEAKKKTVFWPPFYGIDGMAFVGNQLRFPLYAVDYAPKGCPWQWFAALGKDPGNIQPGCFNYKFELIILQFRMELAATVKLWRQIDGSLIVI